MTSTDNPAASIAHRLANLATPRGYRLGVETSEGILDVPETAASLGLSAPTDVDDLLQNRRGGELVALLSAVKDGGAVLRQPTEVTFGPVVTRPEKIVCAGFNYRAHAEETGTPIPELPALFNKFNNALLGHGGQLKLPTHVAERFDYETELVIVIGRHCENVDARDALQYVAGYATGNDFSARDLQMATSQFMLGKTSTGFAPVGPWLAPASAVPDPQNLRLRTFVNGEVRQDWTTADMIFDCRYLIAYTSKVFPLKPGDLIFTGTPQGVILGQPIPAEQRRWLRPGDEVVSSVEGLGDLKVTLV